MIGRGVAEATKCGFKIALKTEHKRAFYATLLTSGKLNAYLADIDEQATKMMFRLVEKMADK